VDNSDDFFDQLPKLTRKRDLKARPRLKEFCISKKQAQINRLKEHSAKIQTNIAMHMEELSKLQVEQKMVRVAQGDFDKLRDRLGELEEAAGKSSARGKSKK
jgi:predicted nuclease with TOPRIM domain